MIKRIKKISIEKMIFFNIMLTLIWLPAIEIFDTLAIINETTWINNAYLLWFEVPVLLFLYILNLLYKKKKVSFVDIIIYILIFLGAISTIFAVNRIVSIFGTYMRNEGLLSLLAYYFIFLNVKNMNNEKYKDIIIKTIIVLGIIQVIYGILQVYTKLKFIQHFLIPYMASGLSGNPNFFGSYMVILTSFTFVMYMFKRKLSYLILATIFFVGLCLSASTCPFISFFLMLIFFVIYYHKKIKKIDILKVLLIFAAAYFLVDFSVKYVHTNIYKQEIDQNYNISLELQNLDLSNLGNGRIELWKNSLPLVSKYWLTGAGLDNFGYVYKAPGVIKYDKVHNGYLQIAITNGIFALISYLVLMGFIFFKGLKIKDEVYIALFMAFIGYCIQIFANISVIEVAPTFFIICGLLTGKINEIKKMQ